MKLLEERIRKDGTIRGTEVLTVSYTHLTLPTT